MEVKPVITDYEALSDRSDEIDLRKENSLARETILNLKATIRDKNLVALTAPQIGVKKRIGCINFNGDIRTFCNPVLTDVKGLQLNREKCPSIPDKTYLRFRHSEVTFWYQDPLGKANSIKLNGLAAMAMQYVVDMLDGLLISDVGLELDENWDKLTEEEKNQVVSMYIESLDLKEKQVKKEVEEDPDTKKISDAIDFMKSVQSGETVLSTED